MGELHWHVSSDEALQFPDTATTATDPVTGVVTTTHAQVSGSYVLSIEHVKGASASAAQVAANKAKIAQAAKDKAAADAAIAAKAGGGTLVVVPSKSSGPALMVVPHKV
jgi:hypothetical protein